MSELHKPVLLDAVMEHLSIKEEGIYIDGTFGRGGHSRAILNRLGEKGMLIAVDRDPQAVLAGKEMMSDPRFHIEHAAFSNLEKVTKHYDVYGKVAGILLDLGVSSPQLDEAERGFSFIKEGPLDMRMNPTQGMSAKEWINQAKEEEIVTVLKDYGEERFAKRIARKIITTRKEKPIMTTKQLADLIEDAVPKREPHKHPATRSFQAIRIFINQELEQIKQCLEQALDVLAVGGRLLVISFHSLEDRIIKRFMRLHEKGEILPKRIPLKQTDIKTRLRCIVRKQKASDEEVKENNRARSAILRVMEKTA